MEPSFDSAYQDHYQKVFNREDALKFFCDLLAPCLPTNKEVQILDIGCGTGLGLAALSMLGYKNTEGLDINPLQVDATRKRGFDAQVITDTALWLQEHPQAFDFIIATDVLEHILDTERVGVVQSVLGSLRPEGRFLCTVPNANSGIASRWRYIDLTHQTSFTESSLRTLLSAGGFENIAIRGSDPFLIFDPPRVTIKRGLSLGLRVVVRAFRRIELVAELGPDEGLTIPLSVNLLALSEKKRDLDE